MCAPATGTTRSTRVSHSRDAVAERQRLFPDHAELIALWQSGWETMLGDAIEETVAILRELRARGLRLYALTNWSYETFPVARRRFDFINWFEDIVISGEVKLAKPDPRIFELARTRCRLSAGLDRIYRRCSAQRGSRALARISCAAFSERGPPAHRARRPQSGELIRAERSSASDRSLR